MSRSLQPEWAKDWFNDVIAKSKFSNTDIRLADSKEWSYSLDAIRHKSGLFFNVVGVNWKDENGKMHSQPLIEQREIGTLGFLLKTRPNKNKILVQAKVEPGNVNICQVGPTYQATASNSARVHGGNTPPYKQYFYSYGQDLAFQTLQSEQGSRFLGKLNRNILVITKKRTPEDFTHKWVDINALLDSVDVNNFLNTDSRSVLVCSPWDKLTGRVPFTKSNDLLSRQLEKSYKTINTTKTAKITKEVNLLRQKYTEPKIVGLNKMKGWKLTPHGVKSQSHGLFSVKQVRVHAVGREVAKWDQPIIDSKSPGSVMLFCALIDEVLQFCFIPKSEPGLVNKVELSPTIAIEPGQNKKLVLPKGSKVLLSVRQSDEGGRFFRDVSTYGIVMVTSYHSKITANGYWLTLGEICKLIIEKSIFTNESRSALSLLLKWV